MITTASILAALLCCAIWLYVKARLEPVSQDDMPYGMEAEADRRKTTVTYDDESLTIGGDEHK